MSIKLDDIVLVEHADGEVERVSLRQLMQVYANRRTGRLNAAFEKDVGFVHNRLVVASNIAIYSRLYEGYRIVKQGLVLTTLVRHYFVVRNLKFKALDPKMLMAVYYQATGINPDPFYPYRFYGGRRMSTRMRHPKTTQELRMGAALAEDGEPAVRCRRNASTLPNAWDDIWRYPERSWKRQRTARKQWMR